MNNLNVGTEVLVVLGNEMDVDGQTLSTGVVVGEFKSICDIKGYFVATCKGIASATNSRLYSGALYSTHCMPIPTYKEWIERNWEIEITDEILGVVTAQNSLANSKQLAEGTYYTTLENNGVEMDGY